MRVLIVKPPFARLMQNCYYNTLPLGAMCVAGMLKQRGHEVAIYHDDVSNPMPIPVGNAGLGNALRKEMGEECYLPFLEAVDGFGPDVVGFSYCTVDAASAWELVGFVRQRGIRTVAGGIHPSLLAEDELAAFDAVVVGEGDHPDAAAAFEDPGEAVVCPPAVHDLDAVRADRDCVIGGERYSSYLRGTIQTQRGCPFACSYCATPTVFGKKVRMRDPGAVREEVEAIGVRAGRIIDDSFGVVRKHGLAICAELAKTQFEWVCDIALQTVDDEMLNALQAGGCKRINIGIESASARWRELSGKRVEMGQPESVLQRAHTANIGVVFYFMVGFPGETADELSATIGYARWLKDQGAKPCISIATPYPGTKLWALAQKQAVLPLSWDGFYHQSDAMGFADCTDAEWERTLKEANEINA